MSINSGTTPHPTQPEIARFVSRAVWQTIDEDPGFASNSASEVAAVAPIFARMYLAGVSGHRVDMEYDREGVDGEFKDGYRTEAGQWAGWKRPDILVHRRGTNLNNLLVLEFKLLEDSQIDVGKVLDLMRQPKLYKYGATIVLNHRGEGHPYWRWLSAEGPLAPLVAVPRVVGTGWGPTS